jgi:Asp-tRNA(Asn)/Glu-tRNA(Gln) amidotransferase A subunit family amidase
MLQPDSRSIPNIAIALRNEGLNPIEYYKELEKIYLRTEPSVKAFIPEESRFTRLRGNVEKLQRIYPNKKGRPSLFCIPIGVKDIFHVDGFQTKAGSQLPENQLKGFEAKSVSILKESGALILGKTITTEFAYFAPGPTRNPHNFQHTPGGSSSGSAAAVASNMVPFAFGTQTIGSIIRPASYCGVVGFKPTYNRISTKGVIPLAPSVDTVGFFTPDIVSAIFFAKVLCKNWRSKFTTITNPVFGIPKGTYLETATTEMLDHFEQISSLLTKAGYVVKEVDAMSDFEDIYFRHNAIVAVEAAKVHDMWFAEYESLYHLKTKELILRGQNIKPSDYQNALQGKRIFRNKINSFMESEGIDLWLSPPALGPAPLGIDNTGDPIMNLPWTHLGFPTINIPAGKNSEGLPMGIQISAGWNQDESLLIWGKDVEQTLKDENQVSPY